MARWVDVPVWAVLLTAPGDETLLAEKGLTDRYTPVARDIAALIGREGSEYGSADVSRDARFGGAAPPVAALALPLRARGAVIGALVAFDDRRSTAVPEFGTIVSSRLDMALTAGALALDNSLRVQRAEALSVTDDLTQLYNSRYLHQALHRETKRAGRSGRPLSLVFVDLDGFKSINDAHGHLYGSRALVEAAAVIRGSARETDVVARFGGDEFALVLPDTGSEGALAVGDRIRERIAAHAFLSGDGLNIRLSASVGVATLPDSATSAEGLLQAADRAMYWVKDHGKNGIRTAAETVAEPAAGS